jgi:hypothetical protein
MNVAGEMFGNIQLALDERPVDDQFRGFVWNPRCFPSLDLLLHRFEVPLNPIDSDGEYVDEAQVLGVLGEHWGEHAWGNVAKSDLQRSPMPLRPHNWILRPPSISPDELILLSRRDDCLLCFSPMLKYSDSDWAVSKRASYCEVSNVSGANLLAG